MPCTGKGSSDPYAAKFLEEIRPLEQVGCARYLNTKSTIELISLFDRAAGLIHFPSEESFGLVVVEALVRNLKFFGARVGGVPDIAAGVEGAELFVEGDWDGLQRAIARWIQGGFPRPATAGEEMRRRYHPDVIARRHVEIYEEVLRTCS
jgi:glycosyltransferase involved in cell wall biosynthesis